MGSPRSPALLRRPLGSHAAMGSPPSRSVSSEFRPGASRSGLPPAATAVASQSVPRAAAPQRAGLGRLASPVTASFPFSFLVGLAGLALGGLSSTASVSMPFTCRILSTGVYLGSSKVCVLGLLNYRAKHIFYPSSKKRFRCHDNYFWASVLQARGVYLQNNFTVHWDAELLHPGWTSSYTTSCKTSQAVPAACSVVIIAIFCCPPLDRVVTCLYRVQPVRSARTRRPC